MHRNMIHNEKPLFIRVFYDRWMKQPNPRFGAVLFLEEVFGPSVCKQTVVTSDDLMSLLTNGWLDMSVITYFTMSLHESMQKLGGNRCAVLNPYEIRGSRCISNMANVMDYLLNVINTHDKDKTFFLAPYYENHHWVLFIIWPHNNTVFVLDSLGLKRKSTNEDNYSIATPIKTILEDIRWIFPKCHQQKEQKGGWECGYYVMRWMHEFIYSQQDDCPQIASIPWDRTDSYEAIDLDNIVALWLSYYWKTCNSWFLVLN
ncbi:uncharacterized protein [Rutidosis leptorrhynchoides]|uniref:uncharacterized protein n=1 Tax=Rutidosis leptorrhynchoides TaxID=125765 RepID=UPI003A9973EA